MPKAVKSLVIAAVVVAVGATFAVLSAAAPREGLSLLDVLIAKLWHLGLFLFFWLAVYAVGRGCERLIAGRVTWPPDLAAALGVAAFVALAFVACAFGLAYGWVAKGLVIGAAAAGIIFMRAEFGRIPARVKRWLGELEVSSAVLVLGAGALALPIALAAAEPAFYWDALTYHLAVPKAYADAHGFTYLPYNVYSSMPMGGSLFYLWPYLWDGLIAAKASHLVATVLALSLSYRLARVWLAQFYAALASVFVILTPPVIVTMGGAHNDHFQVLFAVAAIYIYFKSDSSNVRAGRRGWLAFGVFIGAAVAVKYTAYAVAAAFVPIWVYDLIKKRIRPSWLLKALVVAFALVLPWLVKAYVERGNPVFPLFYDVFDGRDFTAEQADRLLAWQGGMGKGRGITDVISLPYRISAEADVSYEEFSGIYLPFLFPFAALAVLFFRRAGRLIAYGWLYLLAWFFGPQQLRFLDAALPALATAAAGVAAAVEVGWGEWPRRVWRSFAVIAVFVVSIPYFAGAVLNATTGHLYLAGMSRERFLKNYVGFYPAEDFINKELPADAKILMVFTNHTLYLERDAVYDSFLEASALLLAAEKADDGDELYALARRWGCTHVHVYHSYERRVWPYYAPRAREVFYDFLQKYGVVVYQDRLNRVYELVGGRR